MSIFLIKKYEELWTEELTQKKYRKQINLLMKILFKKSN